MYVRMYIYTYTGVLKICSNCGHESHIRTKKCDCGNEFKSKTAKELANRVVNPHKTWNLLQRKVSLLE